MNNTKLTAAIGGAVVATIASAILLTGSTTGFTVTHIKRVGDASYVTFTTTAGKYYKLQSTTNFVNWTEVFGEVKGDGNPKTIVDVTDAPTKFYRAVQRTNATEIPEYPPMPPVPVGGSVL